MNEIDIKKTTQKTGNMRRLLSLVAAIVIGLTTGQSAWAADIPVGAIFWTCHFDSSTQRTKVGFVDRSSDRLPRPKEGLTCAEYLGAHLEAGACPPPSASCYEDQEYIPPSKRVANQSCVNMLVYGPAFC